jgi:hypothetical protein
MSQVLLCQHIHGQARYTLLAKREKIYWILWCSSCKVCNGMGKQNMWVRVPENDGDLNPESSNDADLLAGLMNPGQPSVRNFSHHQRVKLVFHLKGIRSLVVQNWNQITHHLSLPRIFSVDRSGTFTMQKQLVFLWMNFAHLDTTLVVASRIFRSSHALDLILYSSTSRWTREI